MGDEDLNLVDGIIRKLLSVQDKPQTEVKTLTNEDLMFLCHEARSVEIASHRSICLFFVIDAVRSF